jgi:hypothetical protein
MPSLPAQLLPVFLAFAPLFSQRVWQPAQVLLLGAILAPGKRTVTSALRVMGLSAERHFQNYHRVLNRAGWNCRHASRILLGLLLTAFASSGPVVLGLDDTVERRWGPRIKARGIYRDPVRSSDSHFVKASGLRWLSLMLLAPIPWAGRVWALPFLTVLAPSARYWEEHRRPRPHKPLTGWARQVVVQVHRWLPTRSLVLVADGAFAAVELLHRLRSGARPVICVTRLRLDASLYDPAPPRRKGAKGRPRLIGTRLPSLQQVLTKPRTVWQRLKLRHWYGESDRQVEITSDTAVWYKHGSPPVPVRWVLVRDPKGKFETCALLCTDLSQAPRQILEWFLMRWPVEVTFQEVRAHLGVETQRQWSDLAIARTTPVLLGVFSIVTLLAHRLARRGVLPIRQAAWYVKTLPTFSDAIALVRQRLWLASTAGASRSRRSMLQLPRALFAGLQQAACYGS